MARDAKWYANWIRLLPTSTADEKMRNLEAADMLEELDKRIPRWISVEEKLPEKGDVVLAMWHGEIEIARYTPHRLGWYNFTTRYDSPNAVTRWMPLPEPPKEEDDG